MQFTLAWRNIWRNKRRSIITIASVFFAVLLALFAESMNYGTHNQMISNMVSFHTGYIQIQDSFYKDEPSLDNAMPYDDMLLEELSPLQQHISYVIPRIESAILAATDQTSRAALVLGSDFEAENRLNNIYDKLTDGEFFTSGEDAVVLAEGLAKFLRLSVGDTLVLIGQGFQGQNAAGKFPVKGIVTHTIRDLNENMIYMPIETAQWLFATEHRITSLLIMPESTRDRDVEALVTQLKNQLEEDEFVVLGWKEMMPELLLAIEFDKASNKVFLTILYMVIGFGIFGTVLTMTLEREREFGMLLAVGMHRYKLSFISVLETLFISLIGVLAGIIGSLPILYYFYLNPIPLTGDMAEAVIEYGFEPVLPFALDPEFFISQAIIIFGISLVVVIYPVLRIVNLNILKAARS